MASQQHKAEARENYSIRNERNAESESNAQKEHLVSNERAEASFDDQFQIHCQCSLRISRL